MTTTPIKRIDSNDYLSEMTIFNHVIYLAGQVPNTPDADIQTQAQEVFANIDFLLATVGSDKNQLLSAQLFVKNLADMPVINSLWANWLQGCPKPTRATVQAELVDPRWGIEIVVTAALPVANI